VTELLQRWVQGDEKALNVLMPLVYQELRRLAHHHLNSERVDHTLQSTALVNEALLRLNGGNPVLLQSRGHFIAIASRLMRQILVDYARNRGARKRDGGCRIAIEDLGEPPGREEDVPPSASSHRGASTGDRQTQRGDRSLTASSAAIVPSQRAHGISGERRKVK
jgi:RNA polymerase sigma factor (TIGR02999 family)